MRQQWYWAGLALFSGAAMAQQQTNQKTVQPSVAAPAVVQRAAAAAPQSAGQAVKFDADKAERDTIHEIEAYLMAQGDEDDILRQHLKEIGNVEGPGGKIEALKQSNDCEQSYVFGLDAKGNALEEFPMLRDYPIAELLSCNPDVQKWVVLLVKKRIDYRHPPKDMANKCVGVKNVIWGQYVLYDQVEEQQKAEEHIAKAQKITIRAAILNGPHMPLMRWHVEFKDAAPDENPSTLMYGTTVPLTRIELTKDHLSAKTLRFSSAGVFITGSIPIYYQSGLDEATKELIMMNSGGYVSLGGFWRF